MQSPGYFILLIFDVPLLDLPTAFLSHLRENSFSQASQHPLPTYQLHPQEIQNPTTVCTLAEPPLPPVSGQSAYSGVWNWGLALLSLCHHYVSLTMCICTIIFLMVFDIFRILTTNSNHPFDHFVM